MTRRLLYIEDDAFVSQLAKRRLEQGDYEVTICSDGGPGLEEARSGNYDLLLLDHMLPTMSGLDVLRALQPELPCPVIMVSSSSELTVAVEAMRIGAADYVIKETDGSFLDLLPRTVDRVINHERLIEEKRLADERIAEQAATIQGVLDNMDPGVTLFDGTGSLAAFNERWTELFDLPLDLIGEDTSLEQIIDHLRTSGEFDAGDESDVETFRSHFASASPFQVDHERPDGRVIDIRGGPMPGGGFIASYTDITDRKEMERELRRLATTDPLTGANNRRRFTEISERELQRCKRYGHPLCVMILDADKFKSVNDTYGHEAGDRVLKALSDVCRTQLRDVDVFGRFGGEEFTLTLPETSRTTAHEAAERLRIALSETPVPLDDGRTISFTVSIGAAVLGNEADTLDDLIARADGALYQAKESGRNRVVFADS